MNTRFFFTKLFFMSWLLCTIAFAFLTNAKPNKHVTVADQIYYQYRDGKIVVNALLKTFGLNISEKE